MPDAVLCFIYINRMFLLDRFVFVTRSLPGWRGCMGVAKIIYLWGWWNRNIALY